IFVAIAALGGCGGSLASPDAQGQGAIDTGFMDAGFGGATFPFDAIVVVDAMPPDAAVDVDVCARPAGVEVPAVPVPGMSCVYSFPTPPCSYLDNAHAGVKIDGVEIPRDTTDTNGWNTVDALGTFEIFGP